MDKEKLILSIMREAEADGEPLTREEAEEIAEMEIKAKANSKTYVSTEKTKKRKSTEKKLDEVKVNLVKMIFDLLENLLDNAEIANPQREITFVHNGENYSLTLTKHRAKK